MNVQVNAVSAMPNIERALRANLTLMLTSGPGIGKSSLFKQTADNFGLDLIDMRLSQCDPTDVNGFPRIDPETGRASYAPMSTFPLEGDSLPKGKSGWLLFLDEFNSAPMAVQAAAYKLVLDRQVGQYKLHPNVRIVCAGNREEDNAIVNRLSTAMQSRLIHMELVADHEAWVEWASSAGIDYRIVSFINFSPDSLYTFRPDHSDHTFACPRTWEFASQLIQGEADLVPLRPILSGTLSTGVAEEFVGYSQVFDQIPTIEEIIANPTGIEIPSEPSTTFAMTGSIANHAKESNIDALMVYVNRMPAEFQVITIKDMMKRAPELRKADAIKEWIKQSARDLL